MPGVGVRDARAARVVGVGAAVLLAGLFGGVGDARAGGQEEAGKLPDKVEFNPYIRPILSDACFHCHGFDPSKRKAGLRLDTFEGATKEVDGHQAVKPGDLSASELWKRVSSTQSAGQMPPPDTGKKLSPRQVALLKRWIEQGATYQKHWAFEAPKRPPLPVIQQAKWPRNAVDAFILARLEAEHLGPSAEASKTTLIRRVTLDLTGLPPAPEEVAAFVADASPGAYDQVVDRLLQSPRYGEHFARYWLDAARYGDTHGMHLDNERSIWPYRDWVVAAFNRNQPFDQFTIEQLAGDLLDKPTREQLTASGFNRCNPTTGEGGAIDEEFRVRYAVDRVETTSAVWMGLTMGCAVCHDHKLDPITQKEFYQMFSIFNNTAENAMDGNALLPAPSMPVPTAEQDQVLKGCAQDLIALDQKLRESAAKMNYSDPATLPAAAPPGPAEQVWIEDDFPAMSNPAVNAGNTPNRWITAGEGPVFSGRRALQREGPGLHQVYFNETAEPLTLGAGATLFAYVHIDPARAPKAVMLQFFANGNWSQRVNWGDADVIPYGTKGTLEKFQAGPLPEAGKWVRLEIEAAKLGLKPGTKIGGMAFTQFDGNAYWDKAGQLSANNPARDPGVSFLAWQLAEAALANKSQLPVELKAVLTKPADRRNELEVGKLREYFLTRVYVDPARTLGPLRAEMTAVRGRQAAVEKEMPSTLISKELDKPRPAWVLLRGAYDQHGEPVSPGVPAVLPPLPPLPQGTIANRLTFARWLVAPENPLMARVNVNRFWQQFFGTGLVKTTNDFGSKGDWPSHPELLDWLATEFIRNGWDVKQLVRLIVTSATYRQDSRVIPELLDKDPENRWLARGPRFRLDGEVLRDSALFTSGLLNPRMGGRGVHPYQPPGIWEAVGYTSSNTAKYTQEHGDALYRRSLYLFWKRTAPPPSMTTFDAPSREACSVRRERTSTPLQALLLLNDPQYVEAARHLGYRMWKHGGTTDAARLSFGFQLVTAREVRSNELTILQQTLATQRQQYAANPAAATQLLGVGESPVPADLPAAELAAFTMAASLLLNLDEVVTKN